MAIPAIKEHATALLVNIRAVSGYIALELVYGHISASINGLIRSSGTSLDSLKKLSTRSSFRCCGTSCSKENQFSTYDRTCCSENPSKFSRELIWRQWRLQIADASRSDKNAYVRVDERERCYDLRHALSVTRLQKLVEAIKNNVRLSDI